MISGGGKGWNSLEKNYRWSRNIWKIFIPCCSFYSVILWCHLLSIDCIIHEIYSDHINEKGISAHIYQINTIELYRIANKVYL